MKHQDYVKAAKEFNKTAGTSIKVMTVKGEALKKETDPASKKRLQDLQQSITKSEKEYADLEEVWRAEKAAVQGTKKIKESIEKVKLTYPGE